MIAPTDARVDPDREGPEAGPPEADRRPIQAPAVAPSRELLDREARISFWDALMRCLAAVHV